MKKENNTMQTVSKIYLQIIPFSNLALWDVKRYLHKTKLNFANSVFLSEILIPYKRAVSKEEMILNKWQIISKINFSGKLFLREFEKIEKYKGNLNLVPSNSIIYSKINVRHGCIYFHEDGKTPFGVSSEYPTYTFDDTRVNGSFLQKTLQCNAFKSLLNTKAAGISKARVKTDDFLDTQIPLPSLSEQNRLVENYNTKISEAEALEKQALILEENIEKYLSDMLGVKRIVNTIDSIGGFLKILSYSRLDKWGISQNVSNEFILEKPYHVKKIRNICIVGSGGTPSRDRKQYYNGEIPWIKTSEVVNDVIYDTEEKISYDAIDNSSAKIYPKNSLIIAMYGQGATRGRTAKLGIDASTNQACAVLYNIDTDIIHVDYLWIYLMNEYERLRSLASGNNQPNLNAGKINEYPIIIPPLSIQNEIIKHIWGDEELKIVGEKDKIKRLHQEAEAMRKEAINEFEEEIFE